MFPVFAAFGRAMRDLALPRVLAIVLLPMLGAIVLWSLLGWYFWTAWTDTVTALIGGTGVARWLATQGVAWILESLSAILVIALILPAVLVTAIVITELAAMPM